MEDVQYLGEVILCDDTLFHCQSWCLMLVWVKDQIHDCKGFASTQDLPIVFRYYTITIISGYKINHSNLCFVILNIQLS